jgi:hypothetical protein
VPFLIDQGKLTVPPKPDVCALCVPLVQNLVEQQGEDMRIYSPNGCVVAF